MAIKAYLKTYKQKTGASKGYSPIDMKMGKDASVRTEVEKASNTKEGESNYAASKLSKSVQDLISFINDKALMEKSMV